MQHVVDSNTALMFGKNGATVSVETHSKKKRAPLPITTNEKSKLTRSGQPLISFVVVSGQSIYDVIELDRSGTVLTAKMNTIKLEDHRSTELTQLLVSYYELIM